MRAYAPAADNLRVRLRSPWLSHSRFSLCVHHIFERTAKMAMAGRVARGTRLPPEVNRILFVKNLPYKITAEEMYDIFGKFGALRQVRVGNTPETRGTAFVVYEDIFDAKNACDHLSGFNISNRYLVVLYYQATKAYKRLDTERAREKLENIKSKYNISGDLTKVKDEIYNAQLTPSVRR